MLNRLFVIALVPFFLSCHGTKQMTMGNNRLWPDYTVLEVKVAKDRMRYAKKARLEQTPKVWFDYDKLDRIQKELPGIVSWRFVLGRYREDDKEMYRSRHNWDANDESKKELWDVTNHLFYMLEVYDGKDKWYFDIGTVCPPPRLCIIMPK